MNTRTEYYRVAFSHFYSETFTDYRDVLNLRSFMESRGIETTVSRSDDREDWQRIPLPSAYHAPALTYTN